MVRGRRGSGTKRQAAREGGGVGMTHLVGGPLDAAQIRDDICIEEWWREHGDTEQAPHEPDLLRFTKL